MACIVPPAYAQENEVNFNEKEQVFVNRINYLLTKHQEKGEKGDFDGMIDVMLDIKEEVESFTGQKICIDDALHYIYKEMKKNGYGVPKEYFKLMKKKIEKREKKKEEEKCQ
jgi:hypothetical protein